MQSPLAPTDEGVMISNFEDIEMLRTSLSSAGHADSTVPKLLMLIIDGEEWRHRLDPHTDAKFELGPKEFRRFITEKPRLGLGQDFEAMKAKFCKTPELLDLWDRATVGKPGSNSVSNNPSWEDQPRTHDGSFIRRNADNISVTPDKQTPTLPPLDHGTSQQYAIRRLRSQAPEQHARVMAGEVSAHAAMVEAGFRPRMIQVVDDPEKAGIKLARHFGREQCITLIEVLREAHSIP